MKSIDYRPFDGDGRHKRTPMLLLPNTQPMAVTNAQARRMIDVIVSYGTPTHSGAASTLWVVLLWCQLHRVQYRLRAAPGEAYVVEIDRQLETAT